MGGQASEVIPFSQLSDNVTMNTELLLNIENDQWQLDRFLLDLPIFIFTTFSLSSPVISSGYLFLDLYHPRH